MTRFGAAVDRIDERIPGADLPLLSVSQTRGVVRRSTLTDRPPRAESLDVYKVCREGDIVFNKMKLRAGAMGVALEDGLVTYHYEVMRPRPEMEPRYIVHLMKSSWFTAELVSRERGISAGGEFGGIRTTEIPFKILRTIDIPLPNLAEQRAIADYLDCETAQIDTLIAKQEQLIATLRERRSGLIASSVLGGQDPLNPTEGFTSLGGAFSVTLGKMLDAGKPRRDGDVELPYVRAANIQDHGLDLSDVKEMAYSPAEAATLDLRAGDLVVVEGGAVGTCTVLTEDMVGWSFQKTVNRIRPHGSASSSWLAHVLRTYRDAGLIDIVCNKSTIPHLTAEKLRALRVPPASPDEQRRIATYLDQQTAKIDALIAKAERFIKLSKERRTALITAAVTGQIDVQASA